MPMPYPGFDVPGAPLSPTMPHLFLGYSLPFCGIPSAVLNTSLPLYPLLTAHLNSLPPLSLTDQIPVEHYFADASEQSLAIKLPSGTDLVAPAPSLHITALEMLALSMATLVAIPGSRLHTDSQASYYAAAHLRQSAFPALQTFLHMAARTKHLTFAWVPSKSNPADAASRSGVGADFNPEYVDLLLTLLANHNSTPASKYQALTSLLHFSTRAGS